MRIGITLLTLVAVFFNHSISFWKLLRNLTNHLKVIEEAFCLISFMTTCFIYTKLILQFQWADHFVQMKIFLKIQLLPNNIRWFVYRQYFENIYIRLIIQNRTRIISYWRTVTILLISECIVTIKLKNQGFRNY